MTDHSLSDDLATLDARRGSASIELSDDGSSYRCVRVFGAPPDRIFRAFTDPDDLRVWFPSGAPAGSEMTVCESDPVEGGRYLYRMVIPEYGPMAWHGTYTGVDRPARIDADEWFVMGETEPAGPPTSQTLTFEPAGDGLTLMTMQVEMPEPEDPETFMEQSAAGLTSSLATLDELVSGE
jgi:uncharacterized protein YndB with AHSA1/START domain